MQLYVRQTNIYPPSSDCILPHTFCLVALSGYFDASFFMQSAKSLKGPNGIACHVLATTYNIEASITVNKDWSRDEVLGKLQIALGAVGVIDKIKLGIQLRESGAELNREMQIAAGAIVVGKLSKEELKIKEKGYSDRTMKTRAR